MAWFSRRRDNLCQAWMIRHRCINMVRLASWRHRASRRVHFPAAYLRPTMTTSFLRTKKPSQIAECHGPSCWLSSDVAHSNVLLLANSSWQQETARQADGR
ncbi:hypothetical protein [Ktedonospora formicarum]|uniref:hypothetical protein n=1 Tax=Ktedonospora formicarum TaxID=2778364 RepID=UPI001C68B025|nr:hypothetical protein [Ktedonospora formicarum]